MPAVPSKSKRSLLADKIAKVPQRKHGPLWDGDVPSKSGRDDLIALRMAARIVMGDQWVKAQRNRSETMLQAEEGYQAATPLGRAVWKAGYVEPRKDIVRKLVPPEYVRNKP